MPSETVTYAMQEKDLIQSLVVILTTSSFVALVFQRLRLALIPSYIIAGIIAGPSGIGLVKSGGALTEIAHLAVVLLLFGVGMELHVSSFRKDARALIGSSIGSCLLCALIGFPVALSFGLSIPQAIVIAMGFSLSSTAVVLKFLSSARELVRGHGQLSLAILVTQDLLVLFMLAAIPTIAAMNGTDLITDTSSDPLLINGLLTALALVVIFIGGQKLLPRLLAESLHARSAEVLTLSAVAATLLTAFLTYKLGFSYEMGAFLIGFLLASSPFRYQLAGQISPLRDLFMAIFFTTLGMELHLPSVLGGLDTILLGTIAVILTKAFAIFFACWVFGIHSQIAIISAIILSQAGEFSLLIFRKSAQNNILSEENVAIAIGIVVLSLLVTPALFVISKKIAEKFGDKIPSPFWINLPSLQTKEETLLSCTGEHIIVAGFGPVGRKVSAMLTETGVPFTVIDFNPDTVRKERAAGLNIVFGDISSETLLEAVNIDKARALLLTFPDTAMAISAAAKARSLNSDIEIVARASSKRERAVLEATEIDDAIIDEELSAKAMVTLAHKFTELERQTP